MPDGKNLEMDNIHNSYGLVICGGKSSRMGTDKSMLVYHSIPQRYFLYNLLSEFCSETFISLNKDQAREESEDYNTLIDIPCYSETGPGAAIRSAFRLFPSFNFFIIGCDYPYINPDIFRAFVAFSNNDITPASFYNEENHTYEPLLAWYPYRYAELLEEMHTAGDYSLRNFLKKTDARKYIAYDKKCLRSIDTKEDYELAKSELVS